MKAPETPAAKKKTRKSKKKEEDKVDSPAGGEIESPKEEDGEF
jgi:hypothetical protein